MNMNKNKPLKSYSEQDTFEHNAESKFELVKCPRNGRNCKHQLIEINKKYSDSDYFYQNKEYQESIEALNIAFNKTFELNEETCANCARTFRYAIIQTLQNIHIELESMTNGLFKKNRYRSSYILAENVLNDFQKLND